MELRDYFRIFQRRWAWVLAIYLITFAGLFFWGRSQATNYRATAEILLEKVPDVIYGPADTVLINRLTDRSTRIKLISSRPVLQRAALNLKDPRFPDAKLETDDKGRPKPNRDLDRAVATLSAHLSVDEVKEIDIVTIAYADAQQDRAILFVNAIADAYADYAKDLITDGIKAARDQTGLVSKAEAESLGKKRERLTQLPRMAGFEADREKLKDLQSQVAEVTALIHDAGGRLAKDRTDRKAIEDEVARPSLHVDLTPARLPRTTATLEKIRQTDQDVAVLRTRSTEADPRLQRLLGERVRLEGLVQDIRKQETEEAVADYRQELRDRHQSLLNDETFLVSRISGLETDRASIKSAIEEFLTKPNPQADERDRLAAEIKQHEQNLAEMQRDLQRMEVSTSYLKESPAKVIHRAQEAPLTAEGGGPRSLAFFALASLLVAIGGAFALEYLNTRIRTEHDVKRYVNLPLYGAVLKIRNETERLLANVAARSPLSEVFNTIATLLETYAEENKAKVFMVASSKAGEGKSTVSSNLATALARGGKRVILIDADLRKAVLHRFFGMDNTKGLSDYLLYSGRPAGEGAEAPPAPIQFSEIVRPSGIENLSIIPSGPHSKNPVALLKSPALRDVVAQAREQADFVLIDVPPVNIAVDTLVISPNVDGILMLVTANETQKDEVTYAKRMIESASGRLIGCILNKMTLTAGGYYHYYYYYSDRYKYYREG